MKKSKMLIVLIILVSILIISVISIGGYLIWKVNFDDDISISTPSYSNYTNNNSNNTQPNNNTPKEEKIETQDEFMQSCSSYTFKEIARNPNNYVGKRATFTGKVIQVQEDDGVVVLRVNITKSQYNNYEDTIMVGYKYKDINESKILEDDIITIYGDLQGNTSYTSVLGAEITLPYIIANYITIK